MSRQLSIARFAKPNVNEPKFAASRTHNSIRCQFCHNCFSSQGFASHIKTHQLDPAARKAAHPKPGKVKLRSEDATETKGKDPTDLTEQEKDEGEMDFEVEDSEDNGERDKEDEEPPAASGDKRKANGARAQQLKAHQVKLVLDKWESMKEEATTEGKTARY
jgi:hypothetical protein